MANETTGTALGCNEYKAAELLGLSVHTLRKDRVTARRFPYFKVGSRVLYSVERLRDALLDMERGGPPPTPKKQARR